MIAKYRAKRIDNNEWVYGVPAYCETGECFILNNVKASKFSKLVEELPKKITDCSFCIADDFEVDPETVGQFTGKKDKKGIDVYEGDVFDVADRYVEVYWNEHLAMWDTKFKAFNGKGGKWFVGGLKSCDWEQYAEVVGNIHEEKILALHMVTLDGIKVTIDINKVSHIKATPQGDDYLIRVHTISGDSYQTMLADLDDIPEELLK